MVDKKKKTTKRITKRDIWISFFLDSANQETFLNATASAKAAGYKARSDVNFGAIGAQNYRKLQKQIEKWIEEEGLSESRIKRKLFEGLDAKETRFFAFQGIVEDEREVISWTERRKYLELVMKMKGMLVEKFEITGSDELIKRLTDAEKRTQEQKHAG